MAGKVHSGQTEMLTCEVCKTHIPADEAISVEAADYVLHLCGPVCYAEWQAEQSGGDSRDPNTGANAAP